MVHDKITLLLKDIAKLKEDLKGIKKDIKEEEKITDEEYLNLKKMYKEMREQIKDYEDTAMVDMLSDDHYNKLREMRMKAEEELGQNRQKLAETLAKLPPKYFEMQIETENGPVKVQVQPEMKVYMNGREEK